MEKLPFDKQLEILILGVYGLPDGIRAAKVLVPSVLGDFRKMLKDAEPGKIVTEEYKTEDRMTAIVISGEMVRKGKNFAPCVRSCIVGTGEAVFAEKIAGKPGAWI